MRLGKILLGRETHKKAANKIDPNLKVVSILLERNTSKTPKKKATKRPAVTNAKLKRFLVYSHY